MSPLATFIARLGRDRRGGMAVEAALVLPAFAMLVIGVINAGLLAHATNSLHYAVEEAARCYAVNTVLCPTNAAAVTYAQGKYLGPNIDPDFVAAPAACGQSVSATGTFELQVAIASYDVPISASACYPAVDPT